MTGAYQVQLDAILALLRGCVGELPSARDLEALTQADSGRVVAIASAHSVLPLLTYGAREPARGKAVADDLRLFLEEMRCRNEARNEAMREQLAELGRAFAAAGFEGVAVKGGADLLSPVFPIGGRFAIDLDILVPPDREDEARDLCLSLGYAFVAPEENYTEQKHLAPLAHPQRAAVIEIHRRVGIGHGDATLPADLVWEHAVTSGLPGLLVPSPATRLLHLVVHAHGTYMPDGGLTSLRDLVELELLGRLVDAAGWALVRDRCEAHGMGVALDGTLAVHRILMGHDRLMAYAVGRDVEVWVARQLDLLGSPGKLRRRHFSGLVKFYLGRLLSSSDVRWMYLRRLLQPSYIARVVRLRLAELRNVQ